MVYREELPKDCPPNDSEEITVEKQVFRVVKTFPPTAEDFLSQRALKPDAIFRDVSECLARGLSVFLDRQDGEKLLKLPLFRGRKLATVRLTPCSGRIQQTFKPSHHTWWPLADYDILAHCHEIRS